MDDGKPSTLIAVPTLGRRPLTSLLTALEAQRKDVDGRVTIAVFDNGGCTESVLAQIHGVDAQHVAVPERGFASVRNAAVSHAVAYDFLVFIDDDEVPDPGWLSAHLQVLILARADVVCGPVHARIAGRGPRWADDGRVIRETRSFRDGPIRAPVGSGNTSIRVSFLRERGLRFDVSYNRSGGEDTDFFVRCQRAGGRIYWTQRAGAVELVDPDRISIRAVMARAYRGAMFYARYARLASDQLPPTRIWRKIVQLGHSVVRVVAAVMLADPPRMARGLRDAAAAVGGIVGLVRRASNTD